MKPTCEQSTSNVSSHTILTNNNYSNIDCIANLSYLPSIFNLLWEDAVVIANAIAIGSQSERCHGIKEASCQTSQATISKTSILFYFLQLLNVQPQLLMMCKIYFTVHMLFPTRCRYALCWCLSKFILSVSNTLGERPMDNDREGVFVFVGIPLWLCVCVCVCVCVRNRERERASTCVRDCQPMGYGYNNIQKICKVPILHLQVLAVA